MDPVRSDDPVTEFLNSFPPMADADLEAEARESVQRTERKAQACRDEYLGRFRPSSGADSIADRLREKGGRRKDFLDRVSTFLSADLFSLWARRREVKINGKSVPVTLQNLASYFSGSKAEISLSVFNHFVGFLRIERASGRITEREYKRAIQAFGDLFSPEAKDVTSKPLAWIYKVDNDYATYQSYDHDLATLEKARDKYWVPKIDRWVTKGWISSMKRDELLQDFNEMFIDEGDDSDLFEVWDRIYQVPPPPPSSPVSEKEVAASFPKVRRVKQGVSSPISPPGLQKTPSPHRPPMHGKSPPLGGSPLIHRGLSSRGLSHGRPSPAGDSPLKGGEPLSASNIGSRVTPPLVSNSRFRRISDESTGVDVRVPRAAKRAILPKIEKK